MRKEQGDDWGGHFGGVRMRWFGGFFGLEVLTRRQSKKMHPRLQRETYGYRRKHEHVVV